MHASVSIVFMKMGKLCTTITATQSMAVSIAFISIVASGVPLSCWCIYSAYTLHSFVERAITNLQGYNSILFLKKASVPIHVCMNISTWFTLHGTTVCRRITEFQYQLKQISINVNARNPFCNLGSLARVRPAEQFPNPLLADSHSLWWQKAGHCLSTVRWSHLCLEIMDLCETLSVKLHPQEADWRFGEGLT